MRIAEIVTGLVMVTLAAVTVFAIRDLPYWSEFTPGPAFAPVWVALAAALLGVALIVTALVQREHEPADWPDREGARRVVLTMLGLAALLFGVPWLGFVPAAVALSLFMLVVVQRRRWLPSLVATAGIMALVVGVFQIWLGVALPKGLLGI